MIYGMNRRNIIIHTLKILLVLTVYVAWVKRVSGLDWMEQEKNIAIGALIIFTIFIVKNYYEEIWTSVELSDRYIIIHIMHKSILIDYENIKGVSKINGTINIWGEDESIIWQLDSRMYVQDLMDNIAIKINK